MKRHALIWCVVGGLSASCRTEETNERTGAAPLPATAQSPAAAASPPTLGLGGYLDVAWAGVLQKDPGGTVYLQIGGNNIALDLATNDFTAQATAAVGKTVLVSGYLLAATGKGDADEIVVEGLQGTGEASGLDLTNAHANKPRRGKKPPPPPPPQPYWNCVASVVSPWQYLFQRFNGTGATQSLANNAALNNCRVGVPAKNVVCILPPSIFARGTLLGNFQNSFGGCGYFDGKKWHVQ